MTSTLLRRRSKRIAESGVLEPSHGSSGGETATKTQNKRRKVIDATTSTTASTHKATKEERLVQLRSDFSLLANELFQLKEYGSIVFWNPLEISPYYGGDLNTSTASSSNLVGQFNDFLQLSGYVLKWDEAIEDDDELKSLPLRFQRKKLAERELVLDSKFPFRQQVIEDSIKRERHILQVAEQLREVEQSKLKYVKKPQMSKSKAKANGKITKRQLKEVEDDEEEQEVDDDEEEQEVVENDEEDAVDDQDEDQDEDVSELVNQLDDDPQESDFECPDTDFKLKAITYTIPPPLVTHPSHIPGWQPETNQDNMLNVLNGSHNREIIDFHPEPLKVISSSSKQFSVPIIDQKLKHYLETNKVAIIDETAQVDYTGSIEEYESIMQQQERLMHKLRQKVNVESRLVLHGDKIEQRKTVLPQAHVKQALDPFRANGYTIPKIQGNSNNATHIDHLLSQGASFSRIHQQMRKQHQLRARKIAQMVEQHFKKKKGEKERLAKEQEQNLKRIARTIAQAVRKRWMQANKVYRYLQLEKEEELKKIKGREHLSQMLEHSTQLLEAQLSKTSASATPTNEEEVEGEEEEEEEEELDQRINSDDELSSNESEDESKESIDMDDSKLTVEQLRVKYSNLHSGETSDVEMEAESVSEKMNGATKLPTFADSDDDESDLDVSHGIGALYNGEIIELTPQPEGYSEEQKLIIEASEKGDANLLESDSDGSLTDSGTNSGSDSDSDSEALSSTEEEAFEKKQSSLGALFGDALENDDDMSVDSMSVSEDDDDNNMSSTTEDEEEPTTPKSPLEEPVFEEEEVNGTKVRDVPLPSLLRGTLRPYQKQGLNWLASLYNNNTNGILADEMGLGKTIQTISLLSYLACEHHVWGPHLIIVPTSVMLNWEMEFKKFAPGFKVLTYYGSPQQRAQKRKGWNKPDAFHVCITSYQLVVHDHQSFKRRRWKYMILDEAHNIKNFRSTRWKALLNFNTENRLLLTGTPLQNNLMELWSLLYFLMPSSKMNQAMPDGFANFEDFQQWFGRPVDRILEQTSKGGTNDLITDDDTVMDRMDEETRTTVARLHQVLRPYLLRRLKKDVEKQMPGKYEHIVYCRLSKRQRFLYDDFMSRAKTRETLASGNFLSIINCLMQLRKVCNHPDLFEVRPIVTSFAVPSCVSSKYDSEVRIFENLIKKDDSQTVDTNFMNLDITSHDNLNHFTSESISKLQTEKEFTEQIQKLDKLIEEAGDYESANPSDYLEYYRHTKAQKQKEVRDKIEQMLYVNKMRCSRKPILGDSTLEFIKSATKNKQVTTDVYDSMVLNIPERTSKMKDVIEKYSVLTPTVVTLDMKDQLIPLQTQYRVREEVQKGAITNPFHHSQVKLSIAFPDKSLLQYDCGKLQKLATLLQNLTAGGHRALIFTQMTKVLDILEQFLNIHGYRYMRLDGATKIEDRQLLTEKFNRDNKIPVFILSTRSGGLGINLTGADTVIFYDSDWNPAMDKQCQDRCHRIGQTRDVHIYRFVSEYTIESNILRKANQKRQLDSVVIQEGEFTTDYFGKFSVKDLLDDTGLVGVNTLSAIGANADDLTQAEDEEDRAAAKAAMQEVALDEDDFLEEHKVPENEEKAAVDTQAIDADYDAGVGHTDEYMLRFIAEGNFNE
ncbi:swr1 complex component [Scheffersomyces spartinae]|uniref:Helicase SWR1 n=1 Tax=Scheffersomyces spartinae TaxID=45513 RepID=A0A9P8AI40_9ASCO|nr:swr1 complex component [Scheffersomyces spartinae]KAG7192749.1 swr1 complex component [Scheffersomyces spartinae]